MLEFENLELERKIKKLTYRDMGQKYAIKWIAVIIGISVMLFMGFVLFHLIDQAFWGPYLFTSPALGVAMIIAPITSITAITVALFVGAFRKFEEKDIETMGNGVSGASKFMGGG